MTDSMETTRQHAMEDVVKALGFKRRDDYLKWYADYGPKAMRDLIHRKL